NANSSARSNSRRCVRRSRRVWTADQPNLGMLKTSRPREGAFWPPGRMQLRIERLPRARSDELDIWLHIASDNLSAADGLLDQIDRAINMLAVYPNAGRARAELGNDLRSYPIA